VETAWENLLYGHLSLDEWASWGHRHLQRWDCSDTGIPSPAIPIPPGQQGQHLQLGNFDSTRDENFDDLVRFLDLRRDPRESTSSRKTATEHDGTDNALPVLFDRCLATPGLTGNEMFAPFLYSPRAEPTIPSPDVVYSPEAIPSFVHHSTPGTEEAHLLYSPKAEPTIPSPDVVHNSETVPSIMQRSILEAEEADRWQACFEDKCCCHGVSFNLHQRCLRCTKQRRCCLPQNCTERKETKESSLRG